jgi:hypothetical protein
LESKLGWMVSISKSDGRHFCAGNMIAPDIMLTGTHTIFIHIHNSYCDYCSVFDYYLLCMEPD